MSCFLQNIYRYFHSTQMATDYIIPDLNEDPIPDLNEPPPTTVMPPAKRKRLTNSEKDRIVHMLMLNYKNDKLERGLIKQIASKYGVTRLVILKIWKVTLQAMKNDDPLDVQRKYKGNNTKVFDLEKVSSIPLHLRTNIRTLVCQLNALNPLSTELFKREKLSHIQMP